MSRVGEWRLGRRPALDGLRGLAILLVIVCHVIDTVTGEDHPALGSAGVTVFFTLSGFLITSLLLEEHTHLGRIRWRHFYERRARRLLPALALVLVVVGSVQVAAGFTGPAALAPVVLYVANWFAAGGHDLGLLPHTWSLAIEEQFYLGWPLVLVCVRRRRWGVEVASAAGILAAVVLRLLLWDGGAGAHRVFFGTDTHADGLLVGCLLAALAYRGRGLPSVSGRYGTLAALSIVTLALVASDAYATDVVLPGVVPWLAAVGVLAACSGGPRWMRDPVMRYLGRRSYGIYLWHFALLLCVGNLTSSLAAAVGTVLVSIGVAELSWRFIEAPFLVRANRSRGAVKAHPPFSTRRLARASAQPMDDSSEAVGSSRSSQPAGPTNPVLPRARG